MTGLEAGRRPSQPSLETAADELEGALRVQGRPGLPDAVREAILAVEFHLDTLRASDGMGPRIRRDAPRLLGPWARLDETMATLLSDLWSVQKSLHLADSDDRLRSLAATMRDASKHETDLFYDTQLALGGPD
jgi:hypothetical protein